VFEGSIILLVVIVTKVAFVAQGRRKRGDR
jgi:hypothetical protein